MALMFMVKTAISNLWVVFFYPFRSQLSQADLKGNKDGVSAKKRGDAPYLPHGSLYYKEKHTEALF